MINKVFEWDFKGHTSEGKSPLQYNYHQKDWNQTLVTVINRASATCHQSDLVGPANVLYVWPNLMNIIETLEYYNPKKRELSGKFAVIPSYALEPNTIIAFNSEDPNNRYKIVVTNFSTDRPIDVAPELPNDDQLGPLTSLTDDLEYMLEKYLTTVLYGTPNVRLATQIKDLIDVIQMGHKVKKHYDSKQVINITDAPNWGEQSKTTCFRDKMFYAKRWTKVERDEMVKNFAKEQTDLDQQEKEHAIRRVYKIEIPKENLTEEEFAEYFNKITNSLKTPE